MQRRAQEWRKAWQWPEEGPLVGALGALLLASRQSWREAEDGRTGGSGSQLELWTEGDPGTGSGPGRRRPQGADGSWPLEARDEAKARRRGRKGRKIGRAHV